MSNVWKTAFFKIEILPFAIHRVIKSVGELKFFEALFILDGEFSD